MGSVRQRAPLHTRVRQEFHGLWDSLVYDVEVKSHLLDYAQSAMYFADRCVRIAVRVLPCVCLATKHHASRQQSLRYSRDGKEREGERERTKRTREREREREREHTHTHELTRTRTHTCTHRRVDPNIVSWNRVVLLHGSTLLF